MVKVALLILTHVLVACGSNSNGGSGTGANETIAFESFDEGALSLAGTITPSDTIPSDTPFMIGYSTSQPSSLFSGNGLKSDILSTSVATVSYSITKLDAGDYYIFAVADTNGDGTFGAGDVGGYYKAGATEAVTTPAEASAVSLSESTQGIDFALGSITD